jgi:hypothetical protein
MIGTKGPPLARKLSGLYVSALQAQDVRDKIGNIRLACWSHNALSRMSASLIVPLELAYMNQLQLIGWNSAAVMTSVSSSMLAGFMSTMLKLWSWMFKFHRFIRRSSLLIKVSPSLFTDMLLI